MVQLRKHEIEILFVSMCGKSFSRCHERHHENSKFKVPKFKLEWETKEACIPLSTFIAHLSLFPLPTLWGSSNLVLDHIRKQGKNENFPEYWGVAEAREYVRVKNLVSKDQNQGCTVKSSCRTGDEIGGHVINANSAEMEHGYKSKSAQSDNVNIN